MAKGWDRVEQRAAEQQEAAEARENWKPQVWLKEGQKIIVRFLEQGNDINQFAVHEYRDTSGNYRTFTCLNDSEDGTPCPGCTSGAKRKLRGVFNIIQRNRPVLRRGQDGKAMKDENGNWIIEGHEDAVVIIDLPGTTTESIRKIDQSEKWKGLMSRDWEISRTGSSPFNPYVIEPADPDAGVVPMSDADQALAAGKHNLDEHMTPPDFATAARYCGVSAAQGGGQPASGGNGGGESSSTPPTNPFLEQAQGQQQG